MRKHDKTKFKELQRQVARLNTDLELMQLALLGLTRRVYDLEQTVLAEQAETLKFSRSD
jgi:uncharacterized coiled-coil protein SlyX